MIKCEVLKQTTLVCEAGSIVEISEQQYELAKSFLKKAEKEEKKEKQTVKKTTKSK